MRCDEGTAQDTQLIEEDNKNGAHVKKMKNIQSKRDSERESKRERGGEKER